MPRRLLLSALTAVFALCGCAYFQSNEKPAPDMATMLHVEPLDAKFFFYVAYDNPEDKPSFGESFRLRVDNDYMSDIAEDEFIEMKTWPGPHTFEVDEIAWSGYVISHATLKETISPGAPTFIVEHVLSDNLAYLSKTDKDRGVKDITAHKRLCNC